MVHELDPFLLRENNEETSSEILVKGFGSSRFTYSFESLEVLDEKSVSVVPRKEDVFAYFVHAFLRESQVLCSDYRRVDEVKA